MTLDCLCLGLLCADLVCDPIETLPKPGQLVETRRMDLSLGGCASNAAYDLAHLGVTVGVGGCVGDDVFGSYLIHTLDHAGVNTNGIHCTADAATATTAVINVDADDRRFIAAVGANRLFSQAMVPAELIESSRVIYIGGFLMLDALETEETLHRLRRARANGALVVLDVIEVKDPAAMERVTRFLPYTDVVLPNTDEAALLTGSTDPWDQARTFLDAGVSTVVITGGEQGVHVMQHGLRLRSDAYPTTFRGGGPVPATRLMLGSSPAISMARISGAVFAGAVRWGPAACAAPQRRAASSTERKLWRSWPAMRCTSRSWTEAAISESVHPLIPSVPPTPALYASCWRTWAQACW